MLRILLPLTLMTFSGLTFALQEGPYAGVGAAFIDSNSTSSDNDRPITFTTIELQGGYKFNQWLGFEARIGTGLSKSSYSNAVGNRTETTIDHYEALYYRIEFDNEIAKLYGLAGFSNIATSTDFSAGNVSSNNSESGLSAGVGVGFATEDRKWNWNFEYRLLLETEDTSFNSFSIILDRRF